MSYDSKPPSIGLWAGDGEKGPVATGNCGGIRFVLWRNDKRGNDKAPDYRLVMEAPQKRDTQDDDREKRPADGGIPDDEIPF